jgi:hypothetical protein
LLVLAFIGLLLFIALLHLRPNLACFAVALFLFVQQPLQRLLMTVSPPASMVFGRIDAVVVVAMALLLPGRLLHLFREGRLPRFPVFLGLAFILSCCLSSLVNGISLNHFLLGTFMLAKLTVVFLFIYASGQTGIEPEKMFKRINVLLAIALIGATVNIAIGPSWSAFSGIVPGVRMGFTRIHGFFRHPSLLGEYAAMGIVLWVIRYTMLRDKRIALWLPLLLMALAASLVIKPVVSLLLVLLVVFIIDVRLRSSLIGVGMLLGVLALVFWQPLSHLAADRFGTYAMDPTGRIRSLSYYYSWEIITGHPFLGVGPGMFGGYVAHLLGTPVYEALGFSEMLTTHLKTTDTYWPHLFGEVGIIGGGLFITLLVVVALQAFRNGCQSKNASMAVLGMVAMLWIMQLSCSAFAKQLFEGTPGWFLAVWVLGYAAANIKTAKQEELSRDEGHG